jgi:adenylyltransferase/sulfurtransferase
MDAELASELIPTYDLILDCTDNFPTKFLLNDAAVIYEKTLIQASIHQYEGQLLTVVPGGPCLRCLWPTVPASDCVGSCAEVGVLGFVPGVLGTLQAAEATKRILQLPALEGEMALVDLLRLDVRGMRIPKDPACPVCGDRPSITGLFADDAFILDAVLDTDLLVDTREPDEVAVAPGAGARSVPLVRFDPEAFEGSRRVVLICESGARSERLARSLHQAGRSEFVSLRGGRRSLR